MNISGEFFYLRTDEIAGITWHEAFQQLMRLLEEILIENLGLSEKELQRILHVFLDALPRMF
jgi:hypothetical protein